MKVEENSEQGCAPDYQNTNAMLYKTTFNRSAAWNWHLLAPLLTHLHQAHFAGCETPNHTASQGQEKAVLVLMTTQSSLQYSFTFTQSHTHSYSASIGSTLLFYEAQFRVQHLAQGHFGMQIAEDWGLNCPYPLSHSRPMCWFNS